MSDNIALQASEQAYALLYGSDGRLLPVHLESGRLLESVFCEHRELIVVREHNNLRWAHFGSRAIQTAMDVGQPWRQVMPCNRHLCAWQLFLDKPDSALILGGGGGAQARYLRHHFPAIRLCGVEQSSKMIDLSSRYFGLNQVLDDLIQADALEFIAQPSEHNYDLIQVDLFARDLMPLGLWQVDFYERCAACLSGSGVFIMNAIVTDTQAFTRLLAAVRGGFRCKTLCLPVPGHDNVLILAFKSRPETALVPLRRRAERLNGVYSMDFAHVLDELVAVNPKTHGRFVMVE